MRTPTCTRLAHFWPGGSPLGAAGGQPHCAARPNPSSAVASEDKWKRAQHVFIWHLERRWNGRQSRRSTSRYKRPDPLGSL